MKYFLSLVATFVVASMGWLLIGAGATVGGGLVLAACAVFAFWMSIHLTFGSVKNYIKYVEEVQVWASHMIP